jgi:hypothetical protein
MFTKIRDRQVNVTAGDIGHGQSLGFDLYETGMNIGWASPEHLSMELIRVCRQSPLIVG